MPKYESKFALGQIVTLDSDDTFEARVTGLLFAAPATPRVEISWLHNGEAKSTTVDEWRLSAIDQYVERD